MAARKLTSDKLEPVPEAGLGPAMRALSLADREWVRLYVDTGDASLAAVDTDSGSRKEVAKVNACKRRWRPDIAAAVIEESRRRLSFNLPIHVSLLERMANGTATEEDGTPIKVPAAVRARVLSNLVALGGLVEKIEVEHHHEHVLTVSEQFAELIRLGKKPEEILVNLPPDEKKKVLELVKKGDGSYG